MALNLDKGKQNAKDINSILSDINQKQEASLKIERERLKIEKERLATDKAISSEQQDVSNVLKDQLAQLKFQKAEKSSILKSTNSLNRISENLTSLGKDDLINQREIKKLGADKLKIDKNIRSLQQVQAKLRKDALDLDETRAELNLLLADNIDDQIKNAIALKVELGQVNQITENIGKNKGVSLFGGISDVLDKIPLLSGLAPAFGAAGKEAETVAADLEKRKFGVDKFNQLRKEGLGIKDALKESGSSVDDIKAFKRGDFTKANRDAAGMSAGMKSMKNSLKKTLGPMALLALAAKQLVTAMIGGDKATGDLAKSMNISYKEALAMRQELRSAAIESGNNFINTKQTQESLVAINQSLGTNVMLSNEMLTQFSEMREMAGFTNEELQGIAAISLTTGKSMNDITGEFMAQAKISATQNGVLLNEKDLLKDIGKVSAATTLSFSKNPKLIAEAVATAKSLGMELQKVDGIANSLLDFESSISAELEAELLLNKDINLEKARQAALNNDLATVAREISDQIGSSAEFSEMNRIQQEALAKSVGMNRDDLAETLFIQEQLAGATGEQAEKDEAILQQRIKAVGLAQAQKELAQDGIDGLRQQASMADRLNAAMDKLLSVFEMLAEPLLAVFDILTPILSGIGQMVKYATTIGQSFGGLTGIFMGLIPILSKAALIARSFALLGFKGAVAAIFRSFSAIPFGLGIPLAIGAVAGLGKLISSGAQKVGDLSIDPNGGPVVSSPREGGIFQGTRNDALRMGPQSALDGGNAVTTQLTDMSATNALLTQLVKKTPEMAPLGLYEVQ